MDHKVSKDMISSGMIPSGEKTQADLGRIQYGSAPSPSSLMEAYRSIYEHHQKDKDGNTIPHEDEINEMAGMAKKAAQRTIAAKRAATAKTAAAKAKPSAPKGNPSSVMGRVSQGLSGAASAAQRADKAIAARGGLKKMGTDYLKKNKSNIKGALLGRTAAGTATRLGGAFVAGRMTSGDNNSGGYDGYKNMQNFHYVPDGDTLSEDLFDALNFLLTEEGYDEKTTMKIIASMDTDFINESLSEENLNEVAPLLALAPLLAKGAVAAKGALAAAKATKVGMAAMKGAKAVSGAVKGIGSALKGGKAAATAGKTGQFMGGAKGVGAANKVSALSKGQSLLGKAGTTIKKKPLEAMMAGSMVMPQGGGGAPQPQAQRAVASGKRTAGMQRMDLDLFDIVKGQLLDEGLTEEECNDVMTTLTLEEINETLQLDEISGKLAMKASRAADVKRAQLAKAGNKAGAAAKAAQASRLYQGGAKRNIASTDYSKPLNPQRKDYPMGKGASYQQKPGM